MRAFLHGSGAGRLACSPLRSFTRPTRIAHGPRFPAYPVDLLSAPGKTQPAPVPLAVVEKSRDAPAS
jgi:hypothetical protein